LEANKNKPVARRNGEKTNVFIRRGREEWEWESVVFMHEIIGYKIGGKRLHLLKIAGAIVLLASLFKILKALSEISAAVGAGHSLPAKAVQDAVFGPFADLFIWLGIALVAAMIYRAGKHLPADEMEIHAHRRRLLSAVAKHKTKKKR